MGFLPARMTRLLIGGHQDLLEPAVDALHHEGVLHLEDYADPTGQTEMGSPLPKGDELSALLVRVRGLQKALGTEGAAGHNGHGQPDANVLARAESAAGPAVEEALRLRTELAALQAAESALASFAGLDVETSLVGGLRTVKLTVGTARIDPSAAFRNAGLVGEVQAHPAPTGLGYAVAAAVAQKDAAAADRLLAECGFTAAQLPAGTGTPAQRLQKLAEQRTQLTAQLSGVEGRIAALRAEWAAPLAALEAQVAGEVEKTQAPLRFGVTDTTFHIEGWVPADRAADVTAKLTQRFGDRLYVHALGDAPRSHDAHAAHASHAHDAHANVAGHDHHDVAGHEGDGHESDPKDEPPVALSNPKAARPYEWILGLLNRPLYNEVDPSKLMLVFFPLFFGLMVGDVVTGLLITLFGVWLKKNKFIGIGGPAVGKALMAGGIVAMVMGAFVFGEAMGIPFVAPPAEPGHEVEMSWAGLFNLGLPNEHQAHGLLFTTGVVDAAGQIEQDPSVNTALREISHPLLPTGVFAPHSDVHLMVGPVPLGIYSKLADVQPLMVVALVIAAIHMVLGLLIGFRNVKAAHGLALAIQEKLAFVTFLIGAAIAVVGSNSAVLLWGGVAIALASAVLLWIGAGKVYGMGFVGPMELISLGGNFVSYTRLAAIGAAEAGLGLAVATICFHTLPGGVIGWILYVICFLGLTLLSILSGGLQSLRLQFVEFFGKFFGGGGRPYVPFGRRAA